MKCTHIDKIKRVINFTLRGSFDKLDIDELHALKPDIKYPKISVSGFKNGEEWSEIYEYTDLLRLYNSDKLRVFLLQKREDILKSQKK